MVGKRKHLQVTRSYLLQSATLQIVCSDSSDPSTFQCMSGRLVWDWPATVVSYLVVSPRRLEIVFPSGALQLPEGVEVAGGQIWKTICEAVSDELHPEGIAKRLYRQSDS
jgi:hypothetical protein